MIPDLKFITENFHRFNKEIFNSSLPVPRFRMTRARTFHGKMVYKIKRVRFKKTAFDFEMRISVSFNLPEEEWEDVVIHEMIHLEIAVHDINDSSSHGPAFRKRMHEINRLHKRNITISAKNTSEQREERFADKRAKAHFICLARFEDGRTGFAIAAKTRIMQLYREMKRIPGIRKMVWVGTIDPWFNSYPRVMSPKLYIVDYEKLKPHLKGALPMQFSDYSCRCVNRPLNPDELLP